MKAIINRELNAYFTSPVGYIFLGVYLLFSGLFFTAINLFNTITEMSYFFSNLTIILTFIVPLLTMRLFAEERRNKTDQLLLTAPITVTKVVLGKYFSAVALFGFALGITLLYPLILLLYGNPLFFPILAHYLGFFFLGCSLIAIGVFVSSTTESQITAAIITFVILLFIQLSGMITSLFNNAIIKKVIDWLSVMRRYNEFTTGILSLSSVVFFVSFASVFIFLTIQTIEKRRWS
ncbi:MAG: ABC transporter permease [Clostridiaceae bacterium]|jgi:ABC-2 type transport system permease protein|nr:ABC transporter permease [Clostridiaceae bacterium]